MESYQVLEREWAAFNDLDPAGMVACSSGTSALHLAFESMRIPPGSEVLCPDYTMVACPRAIVMAGFTPVFVDCGDDLLMDPKLSIKAICDHPNSRAVLAVHVYGRRCDMDDIGDVPDKFLVIEDMAEIQGVRPHPESDAACWSFYSNKIIAGAEGGAVWFRDPKHAALARQLRSLGFTDAHDYDHVPRGHNYRMSNVHAELVLLKLRKWGRELLFPDGQRGTTEGMRRRIEGWYDAACPPEWRMPRRDAVWIYDVRVPGMTRATMGRVIKLLNEVGIAGRYGFLPMSLQKEFQGCRKIHGSPNSHRGNWTEAEVASAECFYLPVTPGKTTEADCERAFDVIWSVLGVA